LFGNNTLLIIRQYQIITSNDALKDSMGRRKGIEEGRAEFNSGGYAMTGRLTLILLGCALIATPLYAQDDMQNQIRLLEQQIQELKTAQARQAVGKLKSDQCLQAFGRDKFCACLGQNLPAIVSFEQYVHTMVTSKEELGYSTMPADQRKMVDATLDTGEKCVEKGFFK